MLTANRQGNICAFKSDTHNCMRCKGLKHSNNKQTDTVEVLPDAEANTAAVQLIPSERAKTTTHSKIQFSH